MSIFSIIYSYTLHTVDCNIFKVSTIECTLGNAQVTIILSFECLNINKKIYERCHRSFNLTYNLAT